MSPSNQPSVTVGTSLTSTTHSAGFPNTKAADIDRLATANAFLVRAKKSEGMGMIEDDSTDIYLFTRCSPLNDF
jgi:hypothetical protein